MGYPLRMQAQDILDFWFNELTPKQHFVKEAALDETIRARFGATLEAAARCELWQWRTSAAGRLAEIIVLDQFSRNVYRDTPRAFAQDPFGLGACTRVGGQWPGRQPPPSAARICLHAVYAQRICAGA